MNRLVQLEIEQGIAVVTIDNPPMNVLSSHLTRELKEVVSQIYDDPNVIVVILTGAAERAFMAGADIKEFPQWIHLEKEELRKVTTANHEVFTMLENLPKPTIAAINGFALGGGCELALACDIRIAEVQAQLGLPEVKLGLFPGAGGTQRLPRLVGEAKAKELMFTGEPVTAEEALTIGLVNQVVAKGKGLARAKEMAGKMTNLSLQSLSRIKQAVNDGIEMDLQSGLELEINLFLDIFKTEDVREGVQAFIEKRSAKFTHK
ncbi:enoyl-CoA hydratase [Bacillus benzoevorans]|uniref:Enoyl-CoA hydratase/carnithine racemase n=1 Tax=Bacillus benzoevorans TaxID=1456 RepID=A0A7X0HW01_9BACI|nr:enoyl-CoA hydratase [Bacillus benzoevorans]MBB6446601.1 enoyl-CoA hydratase/carnithine racemase [Bacillus benzoevorans]